MHKLKDYCPSVVKTVGRLVLRRSERAKLVREMSIRKAQNSLIAEQYAPPIQSLIVFIVDGADWTTGEERISGGLLSIASLLEETKKLKELHRSEVMMVTLDSSHLILRHTQFENDITVFRLSQVFSHFRNLNSLLIHVPEFLVPQLSIELKTRFAKRLRAVRKVHINILNQNILFMPPPQAAEPLKRFANEVTMTTAHVRYCTEELADKYGVNVHHFSAFVCPEQYRRIHYAEKSNLMIVSPDPHPLKAAILQHLQRELPRLRLQVIQKMTYTEYKETIATAKWAITFGEGLDGYFLETVLSGGISFAVFNDFFFPKEFAGLPTVFASYEEMRLNIAQMMVRLDNMTSFAECQSTQFDLLHKYYRHEEYLDNIRRFYERDYDIKREDVPVGAQRDLLRPCSSGGRPPGN